jgi:Na+-transporting NADH:ubiquinone oxidoreductase subunit NqrA
LTTYGKALARLNQYQTAKGALDRAMEVARQAGNPTSFGLAALTIIEELGKELHPDQMYQYFQTAESGLSSSQHRQIRMRLGECARQLVFVTRPFGDTTSSESSTIAVPATPDEEPIKADWPEGYSLEAEVLSYEAKLIRQALEATGGSVTRAARLLGVTHQGLAFILNGRHKDLLAIRTPVKRRRRSIIRYH